MIRKTALLLVLVLSVGAARVLACELACADTAAKHSDVACHEESGATTTMGSGAAEQCDYATIALSVTGPQKTTAIQRPPTAFCDLRAGGPLPSMTRDEFFATQPGPPPISLSTRTPVLRI